MARHVLPVSRFPSEAITIISRLIGPAQTRVLLEKLEAAGFSMLKEPTLADFHEIAGRNSAAVEEMMAAASKGEKPVAYTIICGSQKRTVPARADGGMPATLEELLEAARHHKMTPEEIEAQRQSWARGELAMGESVADKPVAYCPRCRQYRGYCPAC